MNIFLIGMRGSGKTTIGKLLAEKLGFNLVEMDKLIEETFLQKLSDYVQKCGWDKFRDQESKTVEKVANLDKVVISCGGGVVERSDNIRKLKQNGFSIYLKANINTLYKRIGEDKDRPLLTDASSMIKDLGKVLQKRKKLYEKSADVIITVDDKNPDQIARELIDTLTIKQLI